jgi:large subunit ribosomal protein L32
MAVPKKKTSKSRKNSRKSNWKKKVLKKALFALSLGKSLESEKQVNFAFNDKSI